MTIPYGDTLSYLKLSQQMGNPLAIRAIAAANGKNNLAIVIPCHRVIGSSGKLVGYAGELWRKQWLLNHEREISQQGQLLLKF
jgi:methylated-DNA-[protein]-cysteine S-methyltransferase